jgi:hypothetical protein
LSAGAERCGRSLLLPLRTSGSPFRPAGNRLPLRSCCRDVFAAGSSHYGVADTELLARGEPG